MSRGRPKESLYDKYIKGKEDILISDCRNGADNNGLCRRLGVSMSTYKRILKNHPDVKRLIQDGKDEADLKVESALYKRAVGYDFEEVTTEIKVSPDGSAQTSVVKKTKKHIPGDTTAQIFWLKNRRPSEWRDKQDIEATVNAFEQLMEELPDEEELPDVK